jgi:hypothetical protein
MLDNNFSETIQIIDQSLHERYKGYDIFCNCFNQYRILIPHDHMAYNTIIVILECNTIIQYSPKTKRFDEFNLCEPTSLQRIYNHIDTELYDIN